MKDKIKTMLLIILSILPYILAIAVIIAYFEILAKYGDMPITEMPGWVYFFLQGGR